MQHKIAIRFEEDRLKIEGMPENYRMEYLAREGKTLYFIDRPKSGEEEGRRYYDTFCVFVGSGDQMRQAKLLSTNRYRDGGTTEIRFDLEGKIGELNFPTFFRHSSKAQRKQGSVAYEGTRPDIRSLQVLYDPIGLVG